MTITGSSLMVGCGGSGGSCGYGSSYGSSGGCVVQPIVTGDGYYEGTLTAGNAQPAPVVAIIADNGDGAIAGQDGSYYRLNVSLPQNSVTGTYFALSQGNPFPNGTQVSSGSIAAAASPNLSGTLTDQTGSTETLAATFDTVYNLGSSLANLAGTWSFVANGFSLTATIRLDGTFTATDTNACTYSGAFSVIDPAFNAYSESYVRVCNSVSVPFTGLATYFPPTGNTKAADIKVMADDNTSEFIVADFQ